MKRQLPILTATVIWNAAIHSRSEIANLAREV